jgi:hypothetical protein
MGILSWLFSSKSGKHSALQDARPLAQTPQPKERLVRSRSGNGRVLNLDGDSETRIYTYVGSVFRGIRTGQTFYVNVVDHDVELRSTSTGTTIDTEKWKTTAISYKGRVCGSLGSRLGYLKEIAAAGYSLRLKVKKTGMYSPGVPDLVALTIDGRALKAWWKLQRASSDEIPLDVEWILKRNRQQTISNRVGLPITEESVTATFYPTEETWLGSDIPSKRRAFSPVFKRLPTKAGSKAQPHILISDKKSGSPLYEVSARSGKSYKTLVEHLEDKGGCRGRLLPDYYGDGFEFLRIVILFG